MTTPAAGDRPLRILLVDDHVLFRRGVREVIDEQSDMHVVTEAADGAEAVRIARELRPDRLDLILMDVEMPGTDGVAATRQILAEDPALPVVMLSASMADHDLIEAVRAGSVGFLNKTLAPSAMVRALRDFHREGALPMSRAQASRVLTYFQQVTSETPPGPAARPTPPNPVDGRLSPREREVIELIAEGCTDRDIAERLVVSENTVKTHVQNILHKLGARNRTEAVAKFRRGV